MDDFHTKDLLQEPHLRFFFLDRPTYSAEKLTGIKRIIWQRKFPEAAAAQQKTQTSPTTRKVAVDDNEKKTDKNIVEMDQEAIVQKIEELKKQKRECFNLFRQLINSEGENKKPSVLSSRENFNKPSSPITINPNTSQNNTVDLMNVDSPVKEDFEDHADASPKTVRSNTPRTSPVLSVTTKPYAHPHVQTSNTSLISSVSADQPPSATGTALDRKFETKIDSTGRETRYGLASSFYPATSVYGKPQMKFHPYNRERYDRGPPPERSEYNPRYTPSERERYPPPSAGSDRGDRYGPPSSQSDRERHPRAGTPVDRERYPPGVPPAERERYPPGPHPPERERYPPGVPPTERERYAGGPPPERERYPSGPPPERERYGQPGYERDRYYERPPPPHDRERYAPPQYERDRYSGGPRYYRGDSRPPPMDRGYHRGYHPPSKDYRRGEDYPGPSPRYRPPLHYRDGPPPRGESIPRGELPPKSNDERRNSDATT